ncbi:MAG: NAD-dependent epimerase/dehydratase family protein [Puniceicoccaceae bacterium]
MRVLITGGAGFIGSHLAYKWSRDAEVIILDNLRTGFTKNLDGLDLEFVEGDIKDAGLVEKCMEGVDLVFHLAAMVSVPESVKSPEACLMDNGLGTLNLLRAAANAKVGRVVFASSAAVYGNNPDMPKVESMLPEPGSPYAVTKLDGEYYMDFYHAQHGISTASLRFFNVFGPRQNPSGPYASAVPVFISKALAGDPIAIFGDGSQTRDFIFVDDIVSALSFLGSRKDITGVFNAGYGKSTRIDELATLVKEKTGSESEILFRDERAGDVKHSFASAEKLVALGWNPGWSFEEGLDLTINSYKDS